MSMAHVMSTTGIIIVISVLNFFALSPPQLIVIAIILKVFEVPLNVFAPDNYYCFF